MDNIEITEYGLIVHGLFFAFIGAWMQWSWNWRRWRKPRDEAEYKELRDRAFDLIQAPDGYYIDRDWELSRRSRAKRRRVDQVSSFSGTPLRVRESRGHIWKNWSKEYSAWKDPRIGLIHGVWHDPQAKRADPDEKLTGRVLDAAFYAEDKIRRAALAREGVERRKRKLRAELNSLRRDLGAKDVVD